jgi:hypothetical protein
LSEEEIKQIEAVVPFDFGYPHSLLSESRYKQISTADPTFVVRNSGFFDGIEETKVRSAPQADVVRVSGD